MKSRLTIALIFCLFARSPNAVQRSTSSRNSDAIEADLKMVDRDIDAFKRRQFIAYDRNYERQVASRSSQIQMLAKEVRSRETNGQDVQCARGILRELFWLMDATANFERVDQRLKDLTSVLASATIKPQPPDCLTLWF
jgi:hypothetical protein